MQAEQPGSNDSAIRVTDTHLEGFMPHANATIVVQVTGSFGHVATQAAPGSPMLALGQPETKKIKASVCLQTSHTIAVQPGTVSSHLPAADQGMRL